MLPSGYSFLGSGVQNPKQRFRALRSRSLVTRVSIPLRACIVYALLVFLLGQRRIVRTGRYRWPWAHYLLGSCALVGSPSWFLAEWLGLPLFVSRYAAIRDSASARRRNSNESKPNAAAILEMSSVSHSTRPTIRLDSEAGVSLTASASHAWVRFVRASWTAMARLIAICVLLTVRGYNTVELSTTLLAVCRVSLIISGHGH